jgi:hypothetical protein
MYQIDLLPTAQEDLNGLRKFEQKEVLDGIKTQLRYEPTVETRNRKRLDPNDLAEWDYELASFAYSTTWKRKRELFESKLSV